MRLGSIGGTNIFRLGGAAVDVRAAGATADGGAVGSSRRLATGRTGRLRRLLLGSAAATALVLSAVPGTAHAVTGRVDTGGALASIFTTSGNLKVCDTIKDGRRAVAMAKDLNTGRFIGDAVDLDGANGLSDAACDVTPLYGGPVPVPAGHEVLVEVWIIDGGSSNAPRENVAVGIFVA